ncbi:hypothetical protein GMORB2_0672 [Geosmithia morbida]|uniref:Uncharacterized protein n=1 Tax=Geosmithia morbida TaxID=1094350 RepID=A0A9P5D8M2_9HYPO|nr:uncharacterized protein GMORB2_0672 [Geosmithia morbida]KAF4126935.1 hypothetical protein GMORB2_0672 [Geosmithia morbida]
MVAYSSRSVHAAAADILGTRGKLLQLRTDISLVFLNNTIHDGSGSAAGPSALQGRKQTACGDVSQCAMDGGGGRPCVIDLLSQRPTSTYVAEGQGHDYWSCDCEEAGGYNTRCKSSSPRRLIVGSLRLCQSAHLTLWSRISCTLHIPFFYFSSASGSLWTTSPLAS